MSTPQKKVEPIPAEYPGVTPYLAVNDAAAAIDRTVQQFVAHNDFRAW